MTPAERLAQRLEGDAYSLPSTWKVGDSPEWDHVNSCTEAAALIRRLAAALSDVYSNEYIFVQDHLEASHAEALRNVKGDV